MWEKPKGLPKWFLKPHNIYEILGSKTLVKTLEIPLWDILLFVITWYVGDVKIAYTKGNSRILDC